MAQSDLTSSERRVRLVLFGILLGGGLVLAAARRARPVWDDLGRQRERFVTGLAVALSESR
jgi:hypothetical protein